MLSPLLNNKARQERPTPEAINAVYIYVCRFHSRCGGSADGEQNLQSILPKSFPTPPPNLPAILPQSSRAGSIESGLHLPAVVAAAGKHISATVAELSTTTAFAN